MKIKNDEYYKAFEAISEHGQGSLSNRLIASLYLLDILDEADAGETIATLLHNVDMNVDEFLRRSGIKDTELARSLVHDITVMSEKGDCPECGSESEGYGNETDGCGVTEEMMVTGVITKKCLNCEHVFQNK